MSTNLTTTFRILAYHVGEGVLTDEQEDRIIELEEHYLEHGVIASKDLLWLVRTMKRLEEM